MNICIFEDIEVEHLSPLTLTRPVYDLRIGLRPLVHELSRSFGDVTTFLHCRGYLAGWTSREYDALVNRVPPGIDVLFVNGRLVPSGRVAATLKSAVKAAQSGRLFVHDDSLVAAWIPNTGEGLAQTDAVTLDHFSGLPREEIEYCRLVSRPWHLFEHLSDDILHAFRLETKNYNIYERPGAHVSTGAHLVGGESIYVGPGARIKAGAVLDASSGPIYIDSHAIVFENAVVTGPALVGERSQVRPGASIKNVSVGPVCKVGGEVHDSIMHSYSSKVHDGFLGHSYIGRWCNLGAGTNNSNLRNDYGPINLFSESAGRYEETDRQFLGLIMGDHSKCSIGTTFNTGSVVGVSCNLFGPGFHPRFIPSFMWGTPPDNYVEYRLDKSIQVMERVLARRDFKTTEIDIELMETVHEGTKSTRSHGVKK